MEISLKKYKDKLSVLLSNKKLIALFAAAGILLIVLPIGQNESENKQAETEEENNNFVLSEYESRLEELLMSIDGVGNAKVMLTLETGEESVYILNEERKTEYENNALTGEQTTEEYVLVETDDNGEMPVKKMIIYPKYAGAVVVCEGGGNKSIQLLILRTISSLTGLSADRISVQKMK